MPRKRLNPDHVLARQISEYIEETQRRGDGRTLKNLSLELDISEPDLYNFLRNNGFPMHLGFATVGQDIYVFPKE